LESDGRAVVGWHDDASGVHVVRTENSDGSWGRSSTLRTDPDPTMIGPGAFALALSDTAIHAAYQYSSSPAASAPSYSVGTASGWSTATLVDNTTLEPRATGIGTDIALVGDDVVIVYLNWISGMGEIREVRFGSTQTRPLPNVLISSMQITDLPGTHPLV